MRNLFACRGVGYRSFGVGDLGVEGLGVSGVSGFGIGVCLEFLAVEVCGFRRLGRCILEM